MLGILLPTRRKNEGKNLGRKYLELGERRRPFLWKKRRAKRADKKTARKKNKAARARSRLDDLPFSTFNVRTEAVNKVHGISRINTLLGPWAAQGCGAFGLQETKRDETTKTVAFGYRVYFSGACSGVKGRKGQHGVRLVIKEDIVKKTGKDGIAIKCIRARLLKARISFKFCLITFVVAHTPTEKAPEGQKAI